MIAGGEQHGSIPSDLVNTYMHFVAEEEIRQGRAPAAGARIYAASPLQVNSLRIGQACVVAQTNPNQADGMLRQTHAELVGDPRYSERPYGAARRLSGIVKLLLFRDDPQAVQRWIDDDYRTNVNAFYFYHQEKLVAERDAPNGGEALRASVKYQRESPALYAQMILGSRVLEKPPSLALQTLPHHNSYGRREHQPRAARFDLAFINPSPDGDPETFKLQVSGGCFGECSADYARGIEERKSDFQILRQKYHNDITLISSCCDVKGLTGGLVVHRLASEYVDGTLRRTPRRTLKSARGRLVKRIQNDARRGLLEPEERS